MIALRAIAGLLGMVPGWVYAILLAGALGGGCVATLQRDKARLTLATSQAEFADARTQAAQALARQLADYRKQEAAWAKSLEGIRHDARKNLLATQTDAVAAAAAGDRLRARLTELAACAGGPAKAASAPVGGASASTPAGLLADVQRRLDQVAERVAQHADASRIAGQACERAYDTLTTTGAPP